jgi:hypothetical protein
MEDINDPVFLKKLGCNEKLVNAILTEKDEKMKIFIVSLAKVVYIKEVRYAQMEEMVSNIEKMKHFISMSDTIDDDIISKTRKLITRLQEQCQLSQNIGDSCHNAFLGFPDRSEKWINEKTIFLHTIFNRILNKVCDTQRFLRELELLCIEGEISFNHTNEISMFQRQPG